MDLSREERDALSQVQIDALFEGYRHRWGEFYASCRILAVEAEFAFPLRSPRTRKPSVAFDCAGKIDLIVERWGQKCVVEHKTTSDSIAPGAPYWDRLKLDAQITQYVLGAYALEHNTSCILYDVIRKPSIRQRQNETLDAYTARLREDIAARPEFYYGQREVVRDDYNISEFFKDLWSYNILIRDFRRQRYWPRYTEACDRFGRCPYLQLCTGEADVDGLRYVRTEREHEELSETTSPKALLTASRMRAMRECPRKHFYRYEALVKPVETSDALSFGSAMHRRLEAWFCELKEKGESS